MNNNRHVIKSSVIPVRDTGIHLVFITDIILTYIPRIRFLFYNLRIFSCLDPSVTHWDDKKMDSKMTRREILEMMSDRNDLSPKQWLCKK